MVVTTTAIAFIALSLGLGFCGLWFFRVFQKSSKQKKPHTGFLISMCFFASALHNSILGFGFLLFAKNSANLYTISIIAHIFLTFFALISLYTVYYIFLPGASPRFAISLVIIISFIGLIYAFAGGQQPFLTQQQSIDWNMNLPFALSTFYLLLISLSVFFYIFMRLFRGTESQGMKLLSSVIMGSAIVGIVNVFVRLILFYNAPTSLRTNVLDTGISIMGAIFVVGFIVVPIVKNFSKSEGNKL